MARWWPTLLVIIVTAVSLTGAGTPAFGQTVRRLWMVSIFLFGSLAVAATVWQGQKVNRETAAFSGTTVSPQASNWQRNGPMVSELSQKVRALEDRVRELETQRQFRTITSETADKLAAYLKQSGNRRVIVSCIPDDMEAYQYANQLTNILKAADWDAQGPQVTTIFGDIRAPGINLYVNAENHTDTVNVLLDGFRKFNIPYQSRVTPSRAIPDPETVELFVGTNRSERVDAGGDEMRPK
jgi:hypothetical protein